MMQTRPNSPLLWSSMLGATAIVGSYGFACMFPFAAIAAVAALTLPRNQAFGLVALVWAVNQAVGFGLHDYPHTLDTAGWGIAIGIAAIVALIAARQLAVLGTQRAVLLSPRSAAALGAAFVGYESTLFAWALVAGGLDTFAPRIVAGIALNDAVWFAALIAVRLLLTRAAPRRFAVA